MAITFSTIIATYNQKKELEKILESIDAQSYKDIEVIVADDGSRVDNVEVMRRKWSFPVKYLWHPDTAFNIAKVRNMAARIAKGEWLHIIDGDTLVGEHTYRPYLSHLNKNVLLWGQRHILNPKILRKRITQKNLDKYTIAGDFRRETMDVIFSGANFVLSKEKYLEVLWNEDFHWYGLDDYDFYYRWLADNHIGRCIKESIAYHLSHMPKVAAQKSRDLLKKTTLKILKDNKPISLESTKQLQKFSSIFFD